MYIVRGRASPQINVIRGRAEEETERDDNGVGCEFVVSRFLISCLPLCARGEMEPRTIRGKPDGGDLNYARMEFARDFSMLLIFFSRGGGLVREVFI